MQRLTKEQAEWLIRTIKAESHREVFTSGFRKLGELVEDVINKCTEKEFPAFEIPMKLLDGVCIGNLAMKLCEGYGVTLDTPEDMVMLWPAEFKQFADGVNKIVEWLNEMEINK